MQEGNYSFSKKWKNVWLWNSSQHLHLQRFSLWIMLPCGWQKKSILLNGHLCQLSTHRKLNCTILIYGSYCILILGNCWCPKLAKADFCTLLNFGLLFEHQSQHKTSVPVFLNCILCPRSDYWPQFQAHPCLPFSLRSHLPQVPFASS